MSGIKWRTPYPPAQKAGDRLSEIMRATQVAAPVAGVTVAETDHMNQAVSLHTQIPKRVVVQIFNQILANAMSSPAVDLNGVVTVAFVFGWLTRDEQAKTDEGGVEHFDAPATCAVAQAALREHGHKFCPDCGIVAVLHGEVTDER